MFVLMWNLYEFSSSFWLFQGYPDPGHWDEKLGICMLCKKLQYYQVVAGICFALLKSFKDSLPMMSPLIVFQHWVLQSCCNLVLGLATVCCKFAVSCPQALFFWHVKSITKGQISYADTEFFYLYLQVCDFLNSKPTAPGKTVHVQPA
jgi:hypothetical protein